MYKRQVPDSTEHTVPIEVDFTEELGSDSYIYGHLVGGEWREEGTDDSVAGKIVVRVAPMSGIKGGDIIHATVNEGGLHVFSKATGERI